MSPELANKLMELPEGRALRDFLLSEANKLNRLDDLDLSDPQEIAIYAKARLFAYKTVKEMLSPLNDATQFDIIQEIDDSISTEMLQQERSPESNQQ
jgi:hypothetical protein